MKLDYYIFKYSYQTCMDWDDGPGHDAGWTTSEEKIFAKTDEGARRKANKFIKDHDGKFPCNGGMCSNRGGYRAISLERRMEVHEVERYLLPLNKRAPKRV